MSKENNKENQNKNINESVSNDPIVEINVRRNYSYVPIDSDVSERPPIPTVDIDKNKKWEWRLTEIISYLPNIIIYLVLGFCFY